MKVKNSKCIRRLAWKTLQASRTRNLIAAAAIALTAVLFTSLFTIALSINEGIQQSNFRQVGGWSHGGFKYLTEQQFDALKDDPLIDACGAFSACPQTRLSTNLMWRSATLTPTKPTGCTAIR